jgi:hypothetical protein
MRRLTRHVRAVVPAISLLIAVAAMGAVQAKGVAESDLESGSGTDVDGHQPWAKAAAAQIARIRAAHAEMVEWDRDVERIRASKRRPDAPPPATRPARKQRTILEADRIRHLHAMFVELWPITAKGDVLLEYDPDELVGRAEDICRAYEAWLGENGRRPIEDVARENLPGTVEAIGSEHCYYAIRVLDRWVKRNSAADRTFCRLYGVMRVTDESRRVAHARAGKWFRSVERRMVWDASAGQFAEPDGGWFKGLTFSLEPRRRLTSAPPESRATRPDDTAPRPPAAPSG